MSKLSKSDERDLSKERLLEEYLTDTRTVYTVLRSVSASGMSRHISLMVAGLNHEGKPALFDITYHASKVLGEKLQERNGRRAIRVSGAGMDMGFHTVYTLSSVLYRGAVEGDAGYALRQEWL